MPDTPLTSVSFANNELTLTDNDQVVGKLHIIGDFQTSDFALSQTTTGSSLAFNEPSGPPADSHAVQLAAHS